MGTSKMSNADWWAKNLGVKPQQPQQSVPMPPSQQPMTPYTPPAPQPQVSASKAMSAKQTDMCPNCGSDNFMTHDPKFEKRCYDCGYPREQSGSRFGSLTGAKVEGSAKAARGNDVANNWNPTQIVGRIDG